jgi:hypothetical protein
LSLYKQQRIAAPHSLAPERAVVKTSIVLFSFSANMKNTKRSQNQMPKAFFCGNRVFYFNNISGL